MCGCLQTSKSIKCIFFYEVYYVAISFIVGVMLTLQILQLRILIDFAQYSVTHKKLACQHY